jgi:hypothetical protein
MTDNEPDVCACDICQASAEYHALSTAEKFAMAWPAPQQRSTAYWRGYAESLEAENYDLVQQLRELEQDLASERARCQACGRHK